MRLNWGRLNTYHLVSGVTLLSLAISGCLRSGIRVVGRAGGILSQASAPTPDPCAGGSSDPHLVGKALSGAPHSTITVNVTGTLSNQQMHFRNLAGQIVKSSSVGASGEVELPSRAGQYTVELVDSCTGKVSYGVATVNLPTTGFVSDPLVSLSYIQNPYRIWPDASIAVGDYDNDGMDDIAFASGSDGSTTNPGNPGIYLYKYDLIQGKMAADGVLPETEIAVGVKFADLNGDGHLDLIWTTHMTEKVRIAFGSASGFSAAVDRNLPVTATGVRYGSDVEIGDLDHDGDIDIVVPGGVYDSVGSTWLSGAVYILNNDGTGNFTGTALEINSGAPLPTAQLADADDDGDLDLFVAGGSGTPYLYRILQKSDGSFSTASAGTDYWSTTSVHGGSWTDALRVSYINSDNKPDAILQNIASQSGFFLSNSSDETLAAGTIPGFTDQHGTRGLLADLNLDGTMEYFMPLRNRALFANKPGILVYDESTFTAGISPNVSNTILGATDLYDWSENCILFGDYNGDGKIDLFMPINASKIIDVLYGS